MPRKKKVEPPPKPLRYFISSLNTHLANAIIEKLFFEVPENLKPTIFGTVAKNIEPSVPINLKVTKVIDASKLIFLSKLVLDCDVIIYDLATCDPEEAEFIIKALKIGEYAEKKYLICISNFLVWSKTPPKEKQEGAEEQPDINEEEQEEPDTEPEEKDIPNDEEAPKKKIYLPFFESDYSIRKSSQNTVQMKSLETLCLSAGISKPVLKTYIICSGLIYGDEEFLLKPFFQRAWLQNPDYLYYLNDGRNRVPMIHMKDLAEFVVKTVERPPSFPYIFAVDYNKKSTLKNIMETISKGLGTGKTERKEDEEKNLPLPEMLKVSVRLKPSRAFQLTEEELALQQEELDAGGEEEGEEKKTKKKLFKFNWHCKEGFSKNIVKLTEEYNDNNVLKPNRVLIIGPPAAGKSFFTGLVAQQFNLPRIEINKICEEGLNLGEGDELGEEIRTAMEEITNKLMEEENEKLEKEKERMEKMGIKVPENMEVDPKKIRARMPGDLLVKLYKRRLMKNDCQNRGYILDNFPRTYDQAKALFLTTVPTKEGEDEIPEDQRQLIINKKLFPTSVIILSASDEFLNEKLRLLPEYKLKGTHFNEDDMVRRLKTYRSIMDNTAGQNIIVDFFQENNFKLLDMKIDGKHNNEEIFNQIVCYVEREGKFLNFIDNITAGEEARKERQEENFKNSTLAQQKLISFEEKKENESRSLAEEKYKLKQEDLKKEEKKILDARSLPLREYLNYNVVSFVSEGLAEIYKTLPDDPVDFLAEYLFKRSLDVKFPDPKAYLDEN